MIALVVDVALHNGKTEVVGMYCVADCGTVINQDIVCAQLEGGIIFGLSAACYEQVTIT